MQTHLSFGERSQFRRRQGDYGAGVSVRSSLPQRGDTLAPVRAAQHTDPMLAVIASQGHELIQDLDRAAGIP